MRWWILAIALLIAMPGNVGAQAAARAQMDTLYRELLSNPADIDKTVQYSKLAESVGDYEAAIPPLERLLIRNAKLYNTRLKIGSLYWKLGSSTMAKAYFTGVANDATAPADVVAEAHRYLSML